MKTKILTFLAFCCFAVSSLQAANEIYATLVDNKFTIYFDEQKDTRPGVLTSWSESLGTKYVPGDALNSITTAVVDYSMRDALPTSTNRWFSNMTNVQEIQLNYLNTSEVTNMWSMFSGCRVLKSIDLSGIRFSTDKVTNMGLMFNYCLALESIDLSKFNTTNVTDMSYMFFKCSTLKSLDLRNFNTVNVTDLSYMFGECSALTTIYSNDDWSDYTALATSEDMFSGCTSLVGGNGTLYDATKTDFTYARPDIKDQLGYFTEVLKVYTEFVESTGTLTYYYGGKYPKRTGIIEFYDPINDPNATRFEKYYKKVTKVVIDESMKEAPLTSARAMFYGRGLYGEYRLINLTVIDSLSYLNTSMVTDMSYMFYGCEALELDSYAYYAIAKFNTQNVTDMSSMFRDCKAIEYVDVSNFNTQNVKDMQGMFQNCESLKVLDLRNFDVQNVTSLREMFRGCKALETILCNEDWSVKAKKARGYDSLVMFEDCDEIKGGNGTRLDKNNVDIKYARPDKPGQLGYFTERATGIDNVSASKRNEATKFFRNGQLFILRNGKTYYITGQEVK